MKRRLFNWYLRAGLLLVGVLLGVNHFFALPPVVYGLGLGLGIALEMIGIYAINHDIKKIRAFKKRVFCATGESACQTK